MIWLKRCFPRCFPRGAVAVSSVQLSSAQPAATLDCGPRSPQQPRSCDYLSGLERKIRFTYHTSSKVRAKMARRTARKASSTFPMASLWMLHLQPLWVLQVPSVPYPLPSKDTGAEILDLCPPGTFPCNLSQEMWHSFLYLLPHLQPGTQQLFQVDHVHMHLPQPRRLLNIKLWNIKYWKAWLESQSQ